MNPRSRRSFTFSSFILALLACLHAGGQVSAQTPAWSPTSSLSTARSLHTATLLTNGKVLIVGGINVIRPCCTNTGVAELYDPATGQWSATGNPASPRSNHIAVRLRNGKVLIASGNGAPFSNILNTAELYDPDTGSWSPTGNLNVARQSPRATLLADGRVLVSGGMVVNGTTASFTNTAEVYDPVTSVWIPTGLMNSGRVLHTVTLLPNGKALAAGGSAASFRPMLQNTAELYDPATNAWTLTGEMTTPRVTHSTTLLADGKVLVTGGSSDGATTVLPQCELYDPATGQWSATGNLTTPRVIHSLTLLSSGRVLAAGGSAANPLKSAELYDPATGTWTATAELAAARQNHTATLLSNGRILAVAGSGAGTGNQLISAELYDPATPSVATVSAASYRLQVSTKSIVAAFGQNFSTATEVATIVPLPTTLAGVTIRIRDSSGTERTAPLFFVSPQQINYQIPEGTAPGQASVTISASDGHSHYGMLDLAPAAPAIFTANQSGSGAAAALDAFTFTAAPFNATRAGGEANIIAVFGSGLGADATDVDGNVSAGVEARLAGQPVTVLYAGRAPGFVGLNQINLQLPAGISAGTHTLVIARSGIVGNSVTLEIR
jgi:uncharacterized protein (TIGR03437 family)